MRIPLLVSLVVLLAACPDPAKDKPKAVVNTPAPTTAVTPEKKPEAGPLANAVAYPFTQEGSTVAWTGAKVTAKHEGAFTQFGGIIEVVDGDITKGRVRAEVEMSSVTTDAEKLIKHLKSPDFFDVDQFKQAKFTSTSIAAGEGGAFKVTGDFTLHGVTRSLTFPAKITVSADEVAAAAEFAINRKDFGIVYPGAPDNLIADEVAIRLDLHAKKRAPEGTPAPAPTPAPTEAAPAK